MIITQSRSLWICAAFVFFGSAVPLLAQVLETESLQRKQEDQQRARTMTRDLLGGVLDVQLRQLDENGLSDQEIYRDIKLMRLNLNHLVETEMSNIVDLLAKAQRLPNEKREAAFVEARQQIRTVVRQLAVERQNLLKRLKIAELVEQVRRLIRHQLAVQTVTKKLPSESQTRQEALTLKSIEDQRDVKELFLHLVDTMVDMKSWSGLLAAAAADGLRILKAAEVGKHLDDAGRQLQAVKFEQASDEQVLVIKGLRDLLRVIERTQGSLNSQNMASIDRVRALTDRQKQIRDETKSLTDNQRPSAELVERQAQLQKEIAKLAEGVRDNAKIEAHIQQAETAALDAAAGLLEGRLEAAQVDQGRVLGNLAALETVLKEQAKQQSHDRSANELADVVKSLEEAKVSMQDAQKKQASAEAKARENSHSAVADVKDVAETAQKTMEKLELPATVESALAETAQSAQEAAKILESATAEKATAIEDKALDKASNALDRAVSTIDAALADAGRQMSAVKIGELARAAEVLERAASEERSIAKEAAALAEADNSAREKSAETAKGLADRQQDVKAIAEKAAEALALTAPAASKNATEGAKQAMQSSADLQSVADQKTSDVKAAATHATQSANDAAQKLADAAKEIRNEIVATATELAKRTSAQAEQLAEARTAVEQTVDRLPRQDKLNQLEAAKQQLGEAMQQQAHAQGKPNAANAMKLAEQIANALDVQDAASAEAMALKTGVGSELKATTMQEEVAEKTQAISEAAAKRPQAQSAKSEGKPDSLAQALSEAQASAARAAKQTLDGNSSDADASRTAIDAALKKAMSLALAEAAKGMEAAPTASLDKSAQAKAATAAKSAQATAAKASTEAAAAVAPAASATAAAEQALSTNADHAAAAQAKAVEELRDAGRKLDSAIQKAATERASGLAQQAKATDLLAERVARVDSAAADAVDRAARTAKMGSDAHESPHQMSAAANAAEMALEHAAAGLGAKEQEVRRDQAIAESVAKLALGQQAAAQTISEQATQLESMATVPGQGDVPTAAQQTSAQKLNDAQQQFADSQRATGQGAVELSGQNEVANQPLREALELASQLPAFDVSNGMLMETELPDGHPNLVSGPPDSEETPAPEATGEETTPQTTEANGDAHAAGQLRSGKPASAKPNALGTGFVPNSPQLTAEMMAGLKAQRAAQKALGQQLPISPHQTKGSQPPDGQANETVLGQPVQSQQADSSKLTKKDGSAAINQKVKDGPIQKQPEGTDAAGKTSSKTREKEENALARPVKEEAWFAKLPPELRKAIRAGAGQKPPRAYEERLKKYFQSVD